METLKRNSRVFKIAYGLTASTAPRRVSRCVLFWRTVWMGLVMWPSALITTFVLSSIIVIFSFLIAGYRPAFRATDYHEIVVPIRRWPKIGHRRVWPFWVWIVILAAYGGSVAAPPVLRWLSSLFTSFLNRTTLFYGGTAVGVVLTFWVIYNLALTFKNSEERQLLKDYLKARKEKFCPIIEIEPKT